MRIAVSFGVILFANITDAATLVPIGKTGVLRTTTHPLDLSGQLILFKSQDAMFKVVQLLNAKADPSLLTQYAACVVPNNTRVLVITGEITGAFASGVESTSDVMVIAGPSAGCRGVVHDDAVKRE
jgi:hypothetical protein